MFEWCWADNPDRGFWPGVTLVQDRKYTSMSLTKHLSTV